MTRSGDAQADAATTSHHRRGFGDDTARARHLRSLADELRWAAAEARVRARPRLVANAFECRAWGADVRAELLELDGWRPGAEDAT